ncbi:MAG: hypothetical protein B7Z30_14200 [Rhizobiales bacterium 12-68-15]|nr:MAG: hypothetical protein B7Z30_14200 [Rhizobiales bacterium 12-68-15]
MEPASAPRLEAPAVPSRQPLCIVAGGGAFPAAVAEAARAQGRDVIMALMTGFADPALERYPHFWFRLGSLGVASARAKAFGARDIVMVGTLTRPRMRDLGLDWATVRLLPRIARLFRGGDNHLLSGVLGIVEEQGFRLIGAHEAAPALLLPEGRLGAVVPSAQDAADIEAAEGTDAMLARYGSLRASGRLRFSAGRGVLVKAPKPGQDRRVDLPSLGPGTITRAAEAGLGGIAFEAGGAIVPDAQDLVRTADAAGLFVLGVVPGGDGGR